MPTVALDIVVGDPPVVAAAGHTFASIADEVARHSAKLRSLASSGSDWAGKAATDAHARSVSLPPKLDKVTASYRAAGNALLAYSRALADAQQRSAAAVAAARRADGDLQAARTAQASAAAADQLAATATATTGGVVPAPSAPRYQASIDEAESRLARAASANAQAHADRDRSASAAAAALKTASHEGVRNQSWWSHFSHSVAHWTATRWREGLAKLSALAGQISLLAGIAAAVLAVGGLFFPPLEAAAAVAQSVALVSGVVANVSATVVALSDKRRRKAGLIGLGMLVLPQAASKLIRRIPIAAGSRIFGVTEGTVEGAAGREIPLGFGSHEEFEHFGATLRAGLDDAGYPSGEAIMQGSAVTGFKFKGGQPFDYKRRSDFDIALTGPDVVEAADLANLDFRGSVPRVGPLSDEQLEVLGLAHAQKALSAVAQRKVAFMVFRSAAQAIGHRPSIRITPR